MANITLENASIEFPIFNSKSRGLINTFFKFGKSESRKVENALGNRASIAALKDISLELNDGDNLGIIGLNGAGKTTLLRMLSGIYEPTGGAISFSGEISSLTDLMLGMDADATGYENVRMRGL